MTPERALGHILLVGTFHFSSKRNVITHEVDDMRSARRQAELDDVTRRLARYEPTKVVVERPYAEPDEINASYAAYRAGAHELDMGEVEQLGFRLAAHLGHERIYPVDIMHEWWEPALDTLMANQPELAAMWDGYVASAQEQANEWSKAVGTSTVTQELAELNTLAEQRNIGLDSSEAAAAW